MCSHRALFMKSTVFSMIEFIMKKMLLPILRNDIIKQLFMIEYWYFIFLTAEVISVKSVAFEWLDRVT